MNEERNARLKEEFHQMMKIQDRPYLSWVATKGTPPFVEEYLLTIRLRSYVLTSVDRRYLVGAADQCLVRVTLWDSFPKAAPYIKMLSLPPVFHPDWYSKGTYSPSIPWKSETSLKDYLIRMLKTLCFDPTLIDETAPANFKALDWYRKNRDENSLFPSDVTELTENSDEEAAALEKDALSFGEIIDSWGVDPPPQSFNPE